MVAGKPAAGYKFNSFQEIKSHSSILFNERLAILFYLLDMKSIALNTNYTVRGVLEVRGLILQIYKNIRTLIRNNPIVRATLNLDTSLPGSYTTDVAIGVINKMIQHCEATEYTPKRLYIITEELNKLEMIIKDILQYFQYFIRPDFRQKPDIELATEKYKEIADRKTIEELRDLVGKRNKIDFENLGTSRVELNTEIEDQSETEEEQYPEEEDGENTF